jgi:hypothetical protein
MFAFGWTFALLGPCQRRYKPRGIMNISREQLAQVRTPFRVFSGFIFVLSLLLVPMIIFIAFTEPYDHFIWVVTAVTMMMGYISGHVTFTGYAPTFLLFTHGSKDDL